MSGGKKKTNQARDTRGIYRFEPPPAGKYRLRFELGTLLLEGASTTADALPEELAAHFHFDPRVEAYRAPAHHYAEALKLLRGRLAANRAPRYQRLPQAALTAAALAEPYPHQHEALQAWQGNRGRGVIALPTGAGKTLVGLLAIAWAGRDALVLVPTIDLMHQWYAQLINAFPDQEIGLIGGGYHEPTSLCVATYDSGARHMDRLGNRFGTLVFDEAHHLPSDFYRCIAEFSLAPYRLGLTATPERSDGKHAELPSLIGPIVFRREPQSLAGDVLAPYRLQKILVTLSARERDEYRAAIEQRNAFLNEQRISLGSIRGWNRFVMQSAKSAAGRRAMLAHQSARRIASAAPAKLRALGAVLAEHCGERTIIFTEDNATAYQIAERFLIPCMTHQTRVKERQLILERFRGGLYRAVVTSKVLNEGVDVPDASVGVILSGSGSQREFTQRLGRLLRRGSDGTKRAVLYELVARDTRDEGVAERRRPDGIDTDDEPPLL